MDKKTFMRDVTILVDSREQNTDHITSWLEQNKIKHERVKLDIGDYSFRIARNGLVRDFSMSAVIERKSCPDELYGNIMDKAIGGTNRLEKEFTAGSMLANQFTLLLEGVTSMEELREYVVPEWKMKMSPQRMRADIGKKCYETLLSWQCANRYGFRVECVLDKLNSGRKIVEEFYYYYRNYTIHLAPRKSS